MASWVFDLLNPLLGGRLLNLQEESSLVPVNLSELD